MAGGNKRQQEHDLDVYFNSPRFKRRLDIIRSHKIPDLPGLPGTAVRPLVMQDYASKIVKQFNLLATHWPIIRDYLITGKYIPRSESKGGILIFDNGRKILANTPEDYHRHGWLKEFDNRGVLISISPEIRQPDLKKFVEQNWKIIKQCLNANYPKRVKRFTPVKKIDDYLAIADSLNRIKDRNKRAIRARSLAVDFNLEIPEIYRVAKKYKQH